MFCRLGKSDGPIFEEGGGEEGEEGEGVRGSVYTWGFVFGILIGLHIWGRIFRGGEVGYIRGRFNGILQYILRIISNTDTDNIKIQMIIRIASIANYSIIISSLKLMKRQICHHIETSQLICSANQLPAFYMMAIFAFNELIGVISLKM